MKKASFWLVLPLLVQAVGCGDSGSSGTGGSGGAPGNAGEVNPQVAKSNATQSIQGARTAIAGDGTAAANQLAGLGASGLSLVGPAAGAGPQSGEYGQAKQALQVGTCECDLTSCTFVGCGDDADPNGLRIDGSLSWADNHVVADLTYTTSSGGANLNFHVGMDVTVTATTIDGTVSNEGTAETSGFTTAWESVITMTDVTFNDSGCPTSGTLDVEASVDGPATADYDGSSSITFDGTGC